MTNNRLPEDEARWRRHTLPPKGQRPNLPSDIVGGFGLHFSSTFIREGGVILSPFTMVCSLSRMTGDTAA
jgi:hypothetical protein